MGTNYYHITHASEKCKCCGRFDPETSRHIGKSSHGWHFTLHVNPEENINTLEDWIKLFNTSDTHIVDEEGRHITPNYMVSIITDRSRPESNDWDATMLHRNHAEQGLNNLVRHKVDGEHCIGNGTGTYDYVVGEFS